MASADGEQSIDNFCQPPSLFYSINKKLTQLPAENDRQAAPLQISDYLQGITGY